MPVYGAKLSRAFGLRYPIKHGIVVFFENRIEPSTAITAIFLYC